MLSGSSNVWTEVRRRKSPEQIHTYYVAGIPQETRVPGLKSLFSGFGKVVDVYVAGRKNKNGEFFAFVRFSQVENNKELESKLEGIEYGGRKLKVNLSRFQRQASFSVKMNPKFPPSRFNHPLPQNPASDRNERKNAFVGSDGRSFAEIVAGSSSGLKRQLLLKCNPERLSSLKLSVIAECKRLEELCNLPSLLASEGVCNFETSFLGGLIVKIQFQSELESSKFRENEFIWEKWLCWVKSGSNYEPRFERLTWLKIVGVPYQAADAPNFNLIAGIFGKVVAPAEGISHAIDLSNAKVGIVTAFRKRINEEVIVMVNNSSYRIGVFETSDDWFPFKSKSSGKEESDSEFDEEGISETWEDNGGKVEVEEGEFIPEVGTGEAQSMPPEMGCREDAKKAEDEKAELLPEANQKTLNMEVDSQDTVITPTVDNVLGTKSDCPVNFLQQGISTGPSFGLPPNMSFGPFPLSPSKIPLPKSPSSAETQKASSIKESFIKRRKLGSVVEPLTEFSDHLSVEVGVLPNPGQPSSALDLNVSVSGSQTDDDIIQNPALSEAEITVILGKQLGFQFDKSDEKVMNALKGAGESILSQ